MTKLTNYTCPIIPKHLLFPEGSLLDSMRYYNIIIIIVINIINNTIHIFNTILNYY